MPEAVPAVVGEAAIGARAQHGEPRVTVRDAVWLPAQRLRELRSPARRAERLGDPPRVDAATCDLLSDRERRSAAVLVQHAVPACVRRYRGSGHAGRQAVSIWLGCGSWMRQQPGVARGSHARPGARGFLDRVGQARERAAHADPGDAGIRARGVALRRAGVAVARDRVVRLRPEAFAAGALAAPAEPDVEVELVHRSRGPRTRVLHERIAPQRHPARLLAHEGVLFGGDLLEIRDILEAELGVVVELTREVQPPESAAIAVTQEPDELQGALRRLGRVGSAPSHERIWARPAPAVPPCSSSASSPAKRRSFGEQCPGAAMLPGSPRPVNAGRGTVGARFPAGAPPPMTSLGFSSPAISSGACLVPHTSQPGMARFGRGADLGEGWSITASSSKTASASSSGRRPAPDPSPRCSSATPGCAPWRPSGDVHSAVAG